MASECSHKVCYETDKVASLPASRRPLQPVETCESKDEDVQLTKFTLSRNPILSTARGILTEPVAPVGEPRIALAKGRRKGRQKRRKRGSDRLNKLEVQFLGSGKGSCLLRLPTELRNYIWELAAFQQPTLLLPSRHGSLASASGLWRVSQQVHEEFQHCVEHYGHITAIVVDFDFTHVMEFIARLSGGAIATRSQPTARTLLIKVKVSTACSPKPASLRVWLDRYRRSDRGININTAYLARGYGLPRWDLRFHPPAPIYPSVGPVFRQLEATLSTEPVGGPHDELSAIVYALSQVDESRKLWLVAQPTQLANDGDVWKVPE
ncbi:hypothetical protein LTR37_014090 [Vermiconidia calcicola]|uniref:Uncharacterized protein n=1 Tax=Vermiconidia calcicola TaxID=1690605 RepID=A0ACC3MUF3_9PEZI|nr:hypothetical protein LTR37_014090 [Vermiconidia calcicola]